MTSDYCFERHEYDAADAGKFDGSRCFGSFCDEDLIAEYPSLSGPDPAASKLKNLWIPIGDSDSLLQRNEKLVEQLKLSNANHVFLKTSDGHEWKLWREYLPEFLKISVGKQQQPRISSSGQ